MIISEFSPSRSFGYKVKRNELQKYAFIVYVYELILKCLLIYKG